MTPFLVLCARFSNRRPKCKITEKTRQHPGVRLSSGALQTTRISMASTALMFRYPAPRRLRMPLRALYSLNSTLEVVTIYILKSAFGLSAIMTPSVF